ncbi:hypothetical protein CKO_00772 [Citrobacter koseri ATCC BAA-895]|uniref:Uncharacterized protein n=1 Tax=Citrobacter koseri (strain ATCC BAA-895 / CDC 4225-83 / SGSC4696) TaxID=290338 RepID=A8AEL0_CITK8|nr:hypothetical protein CKO_00772 [Citrobacter koseri ATCC BAA-895]
MRHGHSPLRRMPSRKQKIAPFSGFLSDNNCRFLVSIYPVRSPASFIE